MFSTGSASPRRWTSSRSPNRSRQFGSSGKEGRAPAPALLSSAQLRAEDVIWIGVRGRRDVAAGDSTEQVARGARGVAVRLHENREEPASARLQPLVVAEEESARDRRGAQVEGACDALLIAECCSPVRRVLDPVVGRPVRGVTSRQDAAFGGGYPNPAAARGNCRQVEGHSALS